MCEGTEEVQTADSNAFKGIVSSTADLIDLESKILKKWEELIHLIEDIRIAGEAYKKKVSSDTVDAARTKKATRRVGALFGALMGFLVGPGILIGMVGGWALGHVLGVAVAANAKNSEVKNNTYQSGNSELRINNYTEVIQDIIQASIHYLEASAA